MVVPLLNHNTGDATDRQSLFIELFAALQLGICLIYCAALLTSHQDAVSGRRPPLKYSFLRRGL